MARKLWKPGQSGNPKGRPKGESFGDFLRTKKGLSKELYDAVHPLLKSEDENIVMKAATFLQEARDGRPAQAVVGADGENFIPYSLTVKVENPANEKKS